MKEKEFIKKLKELNMWDNGFIIPVSYIIDEKTNNVILSEEELYEEFEIRMNELREVLK